jgi:hypothetical protein
MANETSNGVAGIIPWAFVPVLKGELARFLFLLVSVTTKKIQRLTQTYTEVGGIISRIFIPAFKGKWASQIPLPIGQRNNQ